MSVINKSDKQMSVCLIIHFWTEQLGWDTVHASCNWCWVLILVDSGTWLLFFPSEKSKKKSCLHTGRKHVLLHQLPDKWICAALYFQVRMQSPPPPDWPFITQYGLLTIERCTRKVRKRRWSEKWCGRFGPASWRTAAQEFNHNTNTNNNNKKRHDMQWSKHETKHTKPHLQMFGVSSTLREKESKSVAPCGIEISPQGGFCLAKPWQWGVNY